MADYMYHPGDIVKIRSDLDPCDNYPMLSGPHEGITRYCVNSPMEKQKGKTFTIKEVGCNGWCYKLCEFDFCWTDSMLEPVHECWCESLL